jgi:hypothetical protein
MACCARIVVEKTPLGADRSFPNLLDNGGTQAEMAELNGKRLVQLTLPIPNEPTSTNCLL